jgi:hypothetical protein
VVFQAVHDNDPDPKLLAYQYLQTLPQLAQGAGNTFWVIPSEVTSALRSVASAFGGGAETAPALGPEPGSGGRAHREPPAQTVGRTPEIDPALVASTAPEIPDMPDTVSAVLATAIPGANFIDPLSPADPTGAETDAPTVTPEADSAVNGTEAGA